MVTSVQKLCPYLNVWQSLCETLKLVIIHLERSNKEFPYLAFIKCNEIWTHDELALWHQNVK